MEPPASLERAVSDDALVCMCLSAWPTASRVLELCTKHTATAGSMQRAARPHASCTSWQDLVEVHCEGGLASSDAPELLWVRHLPVMHVHAWNSCSLPRVCVSRSSVSNGWLARRQANDCCEFIVQYSITELDIAEAGTSTHTFSRSTTHIIATYYIFPFHTPQPLHSSAFPSC